MLDLVKIFAGARSTVNFKPRDLVTELLVFGELDAAAKLMALDSQTIAAIGVLASKHYLLQTSHSSTRRFVTTSLNFWEGHPRPLQRSRRRYSSL